MSEWTTTVPTEPGLYPWKSVDTDGYCEVDEDGDVQAFVRWWKVPLAGWRFGTRLEPAGAVTPELVERVLRAFVKACCPVERKLKLEGMWEGAMLRHMPEMVADLNGEPSELACLDCRAPYPFGVDVTLPDQQWEHLCPTDGILCPTCICKRAEQLRGATVLLAWIDNIDWSAERPESWFAARLNEPPKPRPMGRFIIRHDGDLGVGVQSDFRYAISWAGREPTWGRGESHVLDDYPVECVTWETNE